MSPEAPSERRRTNSPCPQASSAGTTRDNGAQLPAVKHAAKRPAKGLDWVTILKISRPGWWLVHVWLYLAPTGQNYAVLQTLPFWLGLLYAVFPLNLLVYGMNDYTDVDIDADNGRKGNFMYGAKCTQEQLRGLPRVIAGMNICGIAVLAAFTGKWAQLSLWLVICVAVNASYNMEPLRLSSKGPFELPCVVGGFSGVTVLSVVVNNVQWPSVCYWSHMSCLVLRTQVWTELLDFEPDSAVNRRTTSTLIGRRASQALVVILLMAEAAICFHCFDDWLLRLFSVSGILVFILLEGVRGTNDKEKKKAMKSQTALGFSLMLWIWHRGIFAA